VTGAEEGRRMRSPKSGEIMDGARAIAFAIEQPADIGVNEIVICPTAQILASLTGSEYSVGLLNPSTKWEYRT